MTRQSFNLYFLSTYLILLSPFLVCSKTADSSSSSPYLFSASTLRTAITARLTKAAPRRNPKICHPDSNLAISIDSRFSNFDLKNPFFLVFFLRLWCDAKTAVICRWMAALACLGKEHLLQFALQTFVRSQVIKWLLNQENKHSYNNTIVIAHYKMTFLNHHTSNLLKIVLSEVIKLLFEARTFLHFSNLLIIVVSQVIKCLFSTKKTNIFLIWGIR